MTSQSPTGQMDKAMAETPKATPDTAKPASWRRYLPLAIIVIGLVTAYAAGVQDYISLAVLAEQRDALKQFVADHRIASALRLFRALCTWPSPLPFPQRPS
jgi:hypothetical protein